MRSSSTPVGSAITLPTDAQPLHTTIQYNGWVGPNPNGYTTEHHIHGQFESDYVAANISAKDFARLVKSPERLDDPFARYIAYLKQSNGLVENVYALEKAGGFHGQGLCRSFRIHQPSPRRRIADAAQPVVYRMAEERQPRAGTRSHSAANKIDLRRDSSPRLSFEAQLDLVCLAS